MVTHLCDMSESGVKMCDHVKIVEPLWFFCMIQFRYYHFLIIKRISRGATNNCFFLINSRQIDVSHLFQ